MSTRVHDIITEKMAESTNAEASSSQDDGGWWNGWFQAAKEKSSQALEFMKKDLTEFTNVMQQESSKAVSKTSETLKETLKTENTAAATDKLKHGISNFLDSVTKALVIEAEDKNEPAVRPREEASAIFDRAKARLHAIQVDPGTYYNEPSGSAKNFQEWQNNFDMEKNKGDISELLVSKVEVRALYTKLVPADVSHADFWQRYFYKVHQLKEDEARKLALMQRADMSKKEESIDWDEEWSSDEEESKKEKVKKSKPISENKTKSESDSSEKEVKQNENDTTNEQMCQNSENIVDEQCEEVLQSTVSSDDTVVITKSEIQVNTEINKNKDTEIDDDKNKNIDSMKQTDDMSKMQEPAEESASTVKDDDSTKGETTLCQSSVAALDNVKSANKTFNENESSTETVVTSEREDKGVDESEKVDISGDNKQLKGEDEKQTSEKNSNIKPETAKSENNVIEISQDEMKLKIKEKNDVVVVNPDRESPSSESSGNKDVVSLDDDWEQDFDVDLTEEDLKAADEIAKKLNLSSTDYTKIAAEMEGDEDWENWD